MLAMEIRLGDLATGDGAFPELRDADVIHLSDNAQPIGVAGLKGGMGSGKPSVALRFQLPDGRYVLAETSMALFLSAADALKSRFGDPRH